MGKSKKVTVNDLQSYVKQDPDNRIHELLGLEKDVIQMAHMTQAARNLVDTVSTEVRESGYISAIALFG